MDIFKLKTFYQVAKLGSLTQASKQLKYSVPNISRQIAALEHDLNVSLFDRKGNKLHLTLQGQVLYTKATHILAEIESVRDLLQDDNTTPAGLLRVSTTQAIASIWLAGHLKGFLKQYPHMQLAILADDRAVDVALRECDIAIRPRVPDTPDLVQTDLMTWRVGLYAHQDYLKKFGTPQTLDDLDHHRLLSRGECGILPYKTINWGLTAGRPDNAYRTPYLRINSLGIIAELALQKMGIACLYHATPEVADGKLIQVLPHIPGPTIDIAYIYPPNLQHSKRITCLQDYLLAEIAKSN